MRGHSITDVWRRLAASISQLLHEQGDDLAQLEKLTEAIRSRPDPFTITTDCNGERQFHIKPEVIDVSCRPKR